MVQIWGKRAALALILSILILGGSEARAQQQPGGATQAPAAPSAAEDLAKECLGDAAEAKSPYDPNAKDLHTYDQGQVAIGQSTVGGVQVVQSVRGGKKVNPKCEQARMLREANNVYSLNLLIMEQKKLVLDYMVFQWVRVAPNAATLQDIKSIAALSGKIGQGRVLLDKRVCATSGKDDVDCAKKALKDLEKEGTCVPKDYPKNVAILNANDNDRAAAAVSCWKRFQRIFLDAKAQARQTVLKHNNARQEMFDSIGALRVGNNMAGDLQVDTVRGVVKEMKDGGRPRTPVPRTVSFGSTVRTKQAYQKVTDFDGTKMNPNSKLDPKANQYQVEDAKQKEAALEADMESARNRLGSRYSEDEAAVSDFQKQGNIGKGAVSPSGSDAAIMEATSDRIEQKAKEQGAKGTAGDSTLIIQYQPGDIKIDANDVQ